MGKWEKDKPSLKYLYVYTDIDIMILGGEIILDIGIHIIIYMMLGVWYKRD